MGANYPVYFTFPIEKCDFNIRTRNALLRAGIHTFGELHQLYIRGELMRVRNIGDKSYAEIVDFIDNNTFSSGEDEDSKQLVNKDEFLKLPINLLAFIMPPETIKNAQHAGINSIGNLLAQSSPSSDKARLSKADIRHVRLFHEEFLERENSDPIKRLLIRLKQHLQDQLDLGRLHHDATFFSISLKEWASTENIGDDLTDILWQVKELSELCNVDCIADEIVYLVNGLSPRVIHILLRRYCGSKITLEDLASEHGVTRERIRQIEVKAIANITSKAENSMVPYIRSAIQISRDFGKLFNLNAWINELDKKGILGDLKGRIRTQPKIEIDTWQFFSSLLRLNEKREWMQDLPFYIIRSLGLEANDLSFSELEKLEGVSKTKKRALIREACYRGGISANIASQELDVERETAEHYLKSKGLIEVIPDWYSFKSEDQRGRWPIRNAAEKMIEACGPINFELFCDGARRHISRFFPSLAPKAVIEHLLRVYGYEIDDGIISLEKGITGSLSRSEEIFISTVQGPKGPILTLYDIAEEFLDAGMSLPSVTKLLASSPIVQRLDRGYYILRGTSISCADREKAQSRVQSIDQDIRVRYTINGCVEYSLTINRYAALTGVVNGYRLPKIGSSWDLVEKDEVLGSVRVDEAFIWGLDPAFSRIEVKTGDRIQLIFNTYQKTVSVRRIMENETEE